MAGLDPAIHDLLLCTQNVDARDERGHDAWRARVRNTIQKVPPYGSRKWAS
jgi:hypothetical protein